MSLRALCVLAVALPLLSPSPVRGAVTAWTDVVVRVYDASGILTGTNTAALDHAGKTLEAASIDVVWRLCPAEARDPGRRSNRHCDVPMAPGELAIRIVRSPVPPHYRGTLPLGDALIDTRNAGGVLATIYSDRVEWLAHVAGADSRVLLGNAIAHELGHLLLATTSHGPVGLMRAFWSQDEVRRSRAQDWSFAPAELAAIRRRAEARQTESRLAFGTR